MRLSDQELIRRARKGDKAAFGQLWERYEKQVYQHCRRWLDSPRRDPAIEASDLLTETFIRALHGLDRYEDRTAEGKGFSVWLLEIAKRLCLKALARQQRRAPFLAAGFAMPNEPLRSVEEAAEEQLLLRLAAQEINSLPEKYQIPLKLTLEEYSHQEIAEHLGISVSSAMQRLSRARKRLRSRLSEQSEQPLILPERYLEARLSDIVRDVRIVTISLPGGRELQLCLGIQRRLPETTEELPPQRLVTWERQREQADRLYYQGRWEQARIAYQETLALQPACVHAAVALARMLRHEKRSTEAIAILTSALTVVPEDARTLLEAERFVTQGKDEEALAGYRAALTTDPLDGQTHYQFCCALGRLSRYEERLVALEEYRHALPGDPTGYIEVYMPCARLGRWDIARPLLEQAVALDPNHPLALKHLFQVRMNLGLHDEETLALAEHLVRIAPDFAESWAELAWIYADLGRHDESIGVLKAFLREHPGSGEAHAALAWRYHYQDDRRQRRKHALAAYTLLPESPYICWTRILVSTVVDRAVLDEIADRFPHDAYLQLQLSRACLGHKRLVAAERFARRSLTLQPENSESHGQLVRVLLARQKWKEAAALLRSCCELHRRYQLAVALEALGSTKEAATVRATILPEAPGDYLALAETAADADCLIDAAAFLKILQQEPQTAGICRRICGLKKRFPGLIELLHQQ
ncbi:MAG: sigma-70 family RNA polymerase sigma factor [Armatimonas sp.]